MSHIDDQGNPTNCLCVVPPDEGDCNGPGNSFESPFPSCDSQDTLELMNEEDPAIIETPKQRPFDPLFSESRGCLCIPGGFEPDPANSLYAWYKMENEYPFGKDRFVFELHLQGLGLINPVPYPLSICPDWSHEFSDVTPGWEQRPT
ncbi:uncharacterized protein METZ01_LOCUS361217, partial [marine metagenome]